MDSTVAYGDLPLQMPLSPIEFVKQPRVILKLSVMVTFMLLSAISVAYIFLFTAIEE